MTPGVAAAAFAVGVVLVVAMFLVFAAYNDVVALERRVDKAWANVDVVLKQRWDELPNLVAAVRGVMRFEEDVLANVTRLRAAYAPEAAVRDQAATSQATTSAVRQLLAVVERYPALRSAANVLEMQHEIERLENLITDRRELYNDQVYRLNARIGQVPAVWLAGVFGWQPRPSFTTAAEPTVREPTKVALG